MASDTTSHKMLVAAAAAASVLVIVAVAAVTIVAIQDMQHVRNDNNGDASKTGSGGSNASSSPADGIRGVVRVADDPDSLSTDIVMPTKVSRPGCEHNDACYLPPSYSAMAGEPVTWTNNDSAFHTVTSGTPDAPLDSFDSGFMDPYESYTLSFEEPGTYEYYCTLHPWMLGTVNVLPKSS